MSSRKQGLTQSQASAKAGISERSGRRIEEGRISVLERKERHWRTRKDPFVEVWDQEIVPLLERQPALDVTTLVEDLQDRHPEKFGNGKKRTFQRRVKAWKALQGPDKEVMFRQAQEPGRQGLSDFTELKDVTVTIAGALLGIFLPGMPLMMGVLPFRDRLRQHHGARAGMAGTNAAVVGILAQRYTSPCERAR